MRLVGIGLVAAAVAAGACTRAEPSAVVAASAETPAASAVTAPAADAKAPDAAKPDDGVGAWREVTIPAGTVVPITLDTSVGSDTSRVEQPVSAHVSRGIVVGGRTVIAAGSHVGGVVTDATRSGKVKGRAHLAMRFDSLTAHDEKYRIHTGAIARTAAATKEKDAAKIGAPAVGGAIIGAIAGGKKGALIGTAVGGGAGTAVVLSTRGQEVRLPRGAALSMRLSEPVTVKIRG